MQAPPCKAPANAPTAERARRRQRSGLFRVGGPKNHVRAAYQLQHQWARGWAVEQTHLADAALRLWPVLNAASGDVAVKRVCWEGQVLGIPLHNGLVSCRRQCSQSDTCN